MKLLPGVRANLSLGGVSLSVGGPGANVNFSKRGTRSTFGLPGTGLHYTSYSSASSGRSRSDRQLEAAIKRSQAAARRDAALADVAAEEAALQDLVNRWRDAPELPGREDYQAGTRRRPFEFGEPAPRPPDPASHRAHLAADLRGTVRGEIPPLTARAFVAVAAGTVAILGAAPFGAGLNWLTGSAAAGFICSVVLALLGGSVVVLVGAASWIRRLIKVRGEVQRRVDEAWESHWAAAQAKHAADMQAWQGRRQQAEQDFEQEETDRVTWARRLLDGEVVALEEAVGASLGDLDFPFETDCRVEVPDSATAYVLLDLPEIEDVIPETRTKVLKDGTKKEAKRTKQERATAYAQLVCGLGLLVARTAHAAGPTIEVVHVAAYTQRRQKRSGAIGDDFVYEIAVSRDETARLDHGKADPTAEVQRLPGRIKLGATGTLGKIPAPKWMDLTEGAGG